jgi:hypothetical protein
MKIVKSLSYSLAILLCIGLLGIELWYWPKIVEAVPEEPVGTMVLMACLVIMPECWTMYRTAQLLKELWLPKNLPETEELFVPVYGARV